MNVNRGLMLVAPKLTPVLDPAFRPAALANRAFRERADEAGGKTIRLAIEQSDGSVFHFSSVIFPPGATEAEANYPYVERLVKFLLWSRGGFRIHVDGPKGLADQLVLHFKKTPTGRFDADLIGKRVYERAIEVVATRNVPAARSNTMPLGRHLDGYRIGFDLGASDRKVAAVVDGNTVFSDEVVWNPVPQTDPQWHFDQIMESLKSAAAHLPRVDAIGGSSAGVIVNNRVMVASLFRGIPTRLFNKRVKGLFLEIKKAWGDIPFEIVNDGEVTALAGAMSLGRNGVLGIALGSSQAAGYVTPEGNITSWLNELAFAPVDYNPDAAVDEWSGDYGCGVQYFSQQAVDRLMPVAGIEAPAAMPLPEKLKLVQKLMLAGDCRAKKIYETIGTYLGYAIAHYADFYNVQHVLILGRVTSGPGGHLIITGAKEVLKVEFPELSRRIGFHVPDEKDKRHGQAVAAASLPK